MNRHTLIVIGIMILTATGSFASTLEWRIILYSTKKLPVDENTEIYFQVTGSNGMSEIGVSRAIIEHSSYQLAFDAGPIKADKIGNVSQILVGREPKPYEHFKEWRVSRIELIGLYWDKPQHNFTFPQPSLFTLGKPYHLIELAKQTISIVLGLKYTAWSVFSIISLLLFAAYFLTKYRPKFYYFKTSTKETILPGHMEDRVRLPLEADKPPLYRDVVARPEEKRHLQGSAV